MSNENEIVLKLTETVNTLAEVVVQNQNRYLSLERTFRWAGVALICLTMMVFYIGVNMVSNVQAQATTADLKQGQSTLAAAEDRIAVTLEKMVGMMEGMQQVLNMPTSTAADGTKVTVMDDLVDGLVMIHRLRLDSNSLRKDLDIENGTGLFSKENINAMTGIKQALQNIHNALKAVPEMAEQMKIMNAKMNAMPVMAEEMRLMSANIRVMSYSMGSTMGRMGNFMPGW